MLIAASKFDETIDRMIMPFSPFGREIGGTRQYRFLLLIFSVPIYHNTVMNDFGQWYFVHIGDIYHN